MDERTSRTHAAAAEAPATPIDTERLRALLAAGPFDWNTVDGINSAFGHDSFKRIGAICELLEAVPALLDEVARLSVERDELWDDVLRALTERNEVAERAASEFAPGPDGQDHIDRQALIQRWLDDGRDGAETWRTSWQKAAERAVTAGAERDTLRTALAGLFDLVVEATDSESYLREIGSPEIRAAAKALGKPNPAGTRAEVVHRLPPDEGGVMPCCGRTPFDVPACDRLAAGDAPITCPGATPDTEGEG